MDLTKLIDGSEKLNVVVDGLVIGEANTLKDIQQKEDRITFTALAMKLSRDKIASIFSGTTPAPAAQQWPFDIVIGDTIIRNVWMVSVDLGYEAEEYMIMSNVELEAEKVISK